jgi:defect-in-organelle-trafficking protein DotD
MTRSIKLSPVLLALLLSACAATKDQAQTDADNEAYARTVLIEKVDSAVRARRELAVATQEGQLLVARKQAAFDSDEVDIDYIGKPQPLLESLAYRYGYKYVETGKHGELATINLRVARKPALEVVRDISLQIDGGADVVLDKDAKIFRLVYKTKKG